MPSVKSDTPKRRMRKITYDVWFGPRCVAGTMRLQHEVHCLVGAWVHRLRTKALLHHGRLAIIIFRSVLPPQAPEHEPSISSSIHHTPSRMAYNETMYPTKLFLVSIPATPNTFPFHSSPTLRAFSTEQTLSLLIPGQPGQCRMSSTVDLARRTTYHLKCIKIGVESKYSIECATCTNYVYHQLTTLAPLHYILMPE
jgi:hypothetical protein